jgi:hypothetical protein
MPNERRSESIWTDRRAHVPSRWRGSPSRGTVSDTLRGGVGERGRKPSGQRSLAERIAIGAGRKPTGARCGESELVDLVVQVDLFSPAPKEVSQ